VGGLRIHPEGRLIDRRLLALAFALVATPAFALDGRVVLKDTGASLADAEVSILGRPGSVRTDAEGRFVWAPTPRPPFEVLVVLPGGHYAKPILVESLGEPPLVLQVAYSMAESLTVTSGSAPGVESAPANGITLLATADIQTRAPVNLAQSVENVAGASTVSEGQAAVPALRGMARGRTLILIDGARVSAERRVGPSATFLDPASVEAVEVSRGPASVAYGSDAFGGVLHVRTRRATPGTPWGGRVEGSLGAGAPQQRVAAEVNKGFARGGLIVQGHYRNFEDWTSPEGEVFNSGARDHGVLARFDHLLAGGLFTAGWQTDLGRDIERPRDNSGTVRFFYPEENSHRASLAWERGPGGTFSRLGLSAFAGAYRVVTDQDRFATAARPRSVERADVAARDFHVRGYAEKAVRGVRLEGGVDVNGRFGLEALDIGLFYGAAGALERETRTVSIEDARRIDAALYLSAEGSVGDALLLSGGLRGDRVGSRNVGGFFGDRDETHSALSGFAAATLQSATGFSATAQVARGFRDPVLSDRYFRGPTGRGFITGNPTLDPETSLQLDLALRYGRGGWRAALYGYHYEIEDLVERYQTETDFFFFRNRGRGRVRGVEAEVHAPLPARFSLEASAHLVDGTLLDDGSALDDMPPATFVLRLRRDFGRGFGWVRGAFYGELDEPGPNEQSRPAYQVVDAGAGVRMGTRVELTIVGRNLLDESYLVSPDARAVLASGRAGLATVTVRF
jgi:outer membrane receptor protein involved in Fe transport